MTHAEIVYIDRLQHEAESSLGAIMRKRKASNQLTKSRQMELDLGLYCTCGHTLASHTYPERVAGPPVCLQCNCVAFTVDLKHATAEQELAETERKYVQHPGPNQTAEYDETDEHDGHIRE